MVVLACKIRRDDAERFRAACKLAGTSPNAVFRAAVHDFLREHGGGDLQASAVDEHNNT
jgi:hypothetical protein